MRIVHIVTSVSRLSGGVGPVVWELARHQRLQGVDSVIVSLEDKFTHQDAMPYSDVPLYTAARSSYSIIAYSHSLSQVMQELVSSANLVHSHGLWLYPGYLARHFAKKEGVPLILSTHGMLEPQSFQYSRWKKYLARILYENANLHYAACFHATSEKEAYNIQAAKCNKPVAVIPIGLDISEYPIRYSEWKSHTAHEKDEKRLLFLSRIHPIKGLLNLATVWNQICHDFPNWQLVIAGPDDKNHLQEVRSKLSSEAAARFTYTGAAYGNEKYKLLQNADIFVLPTLSENFGIVILEAMACGLPVITTKGAPWKDIEDCRCGWWVDIGSEPLKKALRTAMTLSDKDRHEIGMRGRLLVERKYSWNINTEKMIDVYKWVLHGGIQPDSMILN